MNVLAWQSFGSTKVYAADTPLHYFKIFDEVKASMKGWGEDEALANLFEAMGKCKDEKSCRRLFLMFVRPHLHSHETFETFDFTEVINA